MGEIDDLAGKLRDLMVRAAEIRPSQVPMGKDGRPDASALARAAGMPGARQTIHRLLTGGIQNRTPTEKPRHPYRMSKPVQDILMALYGLENVSDLWKLIETARTRPPWPAGRGGGRKPGKGRKSAARKKIRAVK